MNAFDFKSTFGMFEMEAAAAVIVEQCLKYGHLEPFSPSDFHFNRDEMVGFIELIYNDWLIHHDHYHATFWPSDSFIERVQPHLPLDWRGTQDVFYPSPSIEPDDDDE